MRPPSSVASVRESEHVTTYTRALRGARALCSPGTRPWTPCPCPCPPSPWCPISLLQFQQHPPVLDPHGTRALVRAQPRDCHVAPGARLAAIPVAPAHHRALAAVEPASRQQAAGRLA